MLFRRLLPVLLVLTWATCAQAAEINEEGAQKLKSIFENMLAYQRETSGTGGGKVEYEGDITVEQAGTYYAVTLPHTRIVYPNGEKLDFGMVSINASPHDQPGQWKMAVAVPTPIILMDPQQTQAIKINIGGQKAAGIWDENLQNFAKLDAQYKNITIESPGNGFSVQIPETQILYDFVSSDGKWSGPGRILIKNIAAVFPGSMSAKVAEIKGDFSIEKYNPAVLKEYREYMQAYMKEFAARQKAGQPPDPAKTNELAHKVSGLLMNSTNGFKSDYTVSGFEMNHPAPDKTLQILKVAKAYFGFGAGGMMENSASIGLRFGYDGLAVTPVPPGYEGVLPSESNIDIALASVPVRQIAEVMQNTFEGAMQQPEMAKLAGFSLLMKAPAILSQAATYIDFKNNYIGNDQYRFELNGQAKADINAVGNFTADLKGKFTGLDVLLERIRAVAIDINHPAAENAQGLLHSLEMMKTYGKPEGVGTDGKPVYMYNFILDPKGQTMMNGQPMGLGGMPAVPPATPPSSQPSPLLPAP